MGELKRMRDALGTLAEVLWRRVTDRKVAQHEVDGAFDRAEAAAAKVGRMEGAFHEVLCDIGESALDCAEVLDELLERADWDCAERVAALFEIVAPDDGAVERARVRAMRGKPRAGLNQLERLVGDPARSRGSRTHALDCLVELGAFDRVARCAPELLREAIGSGDRGYMRLVACALHDAFFFFDEDAEAVERLARLGRLNGGGTAVQ